METIPRLFDDVIGTDGSYNKLNNLLSELSILSIKYDKAKFFKKSILNKIQSKTKEALALIKEYDSKCIFK